MQNELDKFLLRYFCVLTVCVDGIHLIYILCMRVFVCVGVQTLFRDELLCLRAEQWAEQNIKANTYKH